VVASLGDRSVAELCRERHVAESLLWKWREQALEAAVERFDAVAAPVPSALTAAPAACQTARKS